MEVLEFASVQFSVFSEEEARRLSWGWGLAFPVAGEEAGETPALPSRKGKRVGSKRWPWRAGRVIFRWRQPEWTARKRARSWGQAA